MQTQVGIIGAGPAGLLLSHLLHLEGIDSVVLEAKSQDYVIGRVRAGVLEQGTVDTLTKSGLGERLHKQGLTHNGIYLLFNRKRHHIDFPKLTNGKNITVYGQREVVKDLIEARQKAGGKLFFEAPATRVEGLEGGKPVIYFEQAGEEQSLSCDYVAGCDGFHGISRAAIPEGFLTVYDRSYPFGWLGILAKAPPSSDELIYANTERGFALHSMRSPSVTRNYLQCDPAEDLGQWPDERIWEELGKRLETDDGFELTPGPIVEKGVTAMRSFVIEPLRYERLFLAGDAAHIVPPTGAKGMNLAIADVRVLARALSDWYERGSSAGLDAYSSTCLRRVWLVTRFSWWMTTMLHRDLNEDAFMHKVQLAQLDYLCASEAAATSLAENYVGLSLEA